MAQYPDAKKMPAYDNKTVTDHQHDPDVAIGAVHDVDVHAPKESFSLWSSLGLQYSLTATPLAIGSYLASVIGVGGSPVFIYGYVFAVLCNLCVCVSLAEIAAVYPHTSGMHTSSRSEALEHTLPLSGKVTDWKCLF
jgi:hypothetical protein